MSVKASGSIFVFYLLAVFFATSLTAATISVQDLGPKLKLISIEGVIEYRDDVEFRIKTLNIPKAVVAFISPGGNLDAGMSIGRQIRQNGYATLVGSKLCASACALAWLGGVHRYMEPDAKIGFHAAYAETGGYVRESGMGNALVGSYLTRLGLGDDAIMYITSAPPQYLNWLDVGSAKQLGIDVFVFKNGKIKSVSQNSDITVKPTANARRAAIAIFKKIKTNGMSGAQTATDICYERVFKLKSMDSIEYCTVLDWFARGWDKNMATTMKWARMDFFSDELVKSRFSKAARSVNWNGQSSTDSFEQWTRSAETLANDKSVYDDAEK